ncbi:MAG TPA: hypothetical protein ACFCUY_04625 [Xenococcaceae cyanobacterium]|jgi:hypothetical protein
MVKNRKSQILSFTTCLKFCLMPTLMLLITGKMIALASWDNFTKMTVMTNPNNIENQNPELPENVANAVLEDLSKKTQIAPEDLSVTQATRELWSNGCLDLPEADEVCTQAIVPGWRVTVSGEERTWVYHADQQGTRLRVEP